MLNTVQTMMSQMTNNSGGNGVPDLSMLTNMLQQSGLDLPLDNLPNLDLPQIMEESTKEE